MRSFVSLPACKRWPHLAGWPRLSFSSSPTWRQFVLRIFFASVELSCWPWDHIEPCSLLWVSPATCPSLQPPCFDFITLHACHPAVFGLFDFIMMGWTFSLSLAQKQAGLRSLSAPRALSCSSRPSPDP